MAYSGNQRPVADDRLPEDGGGGGAVLPGPLHDLGAGGDVAPLARGAAGGRGATVPGGREGDRGVDGDGDEGGPLAEVRGGRLPNGARPAEAREQDRLRIAIPAKGRLREPCVALLEDAGLGPEQPGERALAFPCRNAPVEVLLVRAADVPEYVQDGVVDCGITGADLVRERGLEVDELLRLGFGACSLEAAVPEEHDASEGLEHPHIGEEGRVFLARLLQGLDDAQIGALFEAARGERRGGVARWVAAFEAKREQVIHPVPADPNFRCPRGRCPDGWIRDARVRRRNSR